MHLKALCAGLILLQCLHGAVAVCTVDLTSNFFIGVSSGAVPGCQHGQILGNDDKCNVKCADNYVSNAAQGTTISCQAPYGKVTLPKLKCTGTCSALPGKTEASPGDVFHALGKGNGLCEQDKRLEVNGSCKVTCKPGYQFMGGDSAAYTCKGALNDPVRTGATCEKQLCDAIGMKGFPVGAVGDEQPGSKVPPCKEGLVLSSIAGDEKCRVTCDLGYQADPATTEKARFAGCERKGAKVVLNVPKLKCIERKCIHDKSKGLSNGIPFAFAPEITGGNAPLCLPGQELRGGTSCKVACKEGFKPVSGTGPDADTYSCTVNGELISASLECEGQSCPLPDTFAGFVGGASRAGNGAASSIAEGYTHSVLFPGSPPDFVEGATPGCSAAGSIAAGSSCSVRCESGYSPVMPSPDAAKYTCFSGSNELVAPTLECVRSPKVTATYEVSSNELNDQELDCMTMKIAENAGFSSREIGATHSGFALDATSITVVYTLPAATAEAAAKSFADQVAAVNTAKTCAIRPVDNGNPAIDPNAHNRLVSTSIEMPTCGLEKDATCFDEIYPCEACCKSDINVFGLSCWDQMYTKARCCVGFTESPIAPPSDAPVATQEAPIEPIAAPPVVESCAKSLGCFDSIYPCSLCCSTGLSIFGASCWDKVFKAAECCSNPSKAAAPTLPPVAPLTMTGTPAPTKTCPYQKDSACFDEFYPCLECCAGSGTSPHFGTSCWDFVYTFERCCKGGVPPAPLAPSSSCDNLQDTMSMQDVCPSWAAAGECTGSQASYVSSTCPKSCSAACNMAGTAQAAGGICVDTKASCQVWAATGECTREGVAAYMTQNCPASCKVAGCGGRRRSRNNAIRGLHADEYGNMLDSRNRVLASELHTSMAALSLSSGGFVDSRGRALPTPSQYRRLMPSDEAENSTPALPIGLGSGAFAGVALVASLLVWRARRSATLTAARSQEDAGAVTGSIVAV